MPKRFIIERYLIRESLQNFAAVVVVLVLIYLSNRFVRYLAEAAAGELDSAVILELLALKLTANAVVLLPLALYVGVLLALGRLYRDSEIVALAAGGVGITRVARAMGVLGLGFAVVVGFLSLVIAPMAAHKAEQLTERARNDSDVTGLYPGRFKDFGGGEHIIYVRDISPDRSEMTSVFVQMRSPTGLDIVFAESGRQFLETRTGDRFMVLTNGYRYEGRPGDPDFVRHEFEKHGVRIRKRAADAAARRLEAMSAAQLLDQGGVEHIAELQWRVSMPIAALLLAVLAVPLARSSPRAGKFGKVFTGILIYFIYSNVLSISYKAVERNELHPLIGVWPAHLLMALVVAVLLAHASGVRLPLPRQRASA